MMLKQEAKQVGLYHSPRMYFI